MDLLLAILYFICTAFAALGAVLAIVKAHKDDFTLGKTMFAVLTVTQALLLLMGGITHVQSYL